MLVIFCKLYALRELLRINIHRHDFTSASHAPWKNRSTQASKPMAFGPGSIRSIMLNFGKALLLLHLLFVMLFLLQAALSTGSRGVDFASELPRPSLAPLLESQRAPTGRAGSAGHAKNSGQGQPGPIDSDDPVADTSLQARLNTEKVPTAASTLTQPSLPFNAAARASETLEASDLAALRAKACQDLQNVARIIMSIESKLGAKGLLVGIIAGAQDKTNLTFEMKQEIKLQVLGKAVERVKEHFLVQVQLFKAGMHTHDPQAISEPLLDAIGKELEQVTMYLLNFQKNYRDKLAKNSVPQGSQHAQPVHAASANTLAVQARPLPASATDGCGSQEDADEEKAAIVKIVHSAISLIYPEALSAESPAARIEAITTCIHRLEDDAGIGHQKLSPKDRQDLRAIHQPHPTGRSTKERNRRLAAAEFLLLKAVPRACGEMVPADNAHNYHLVYRYVGLLLTNSDKKGKWRGHSHFWQSLDLLQRNIHVEEADASSKASPTKATENTQKQPAPPRDAASEQQSPAEEPLSPAPDTKNRQKTMSPSTIYRDILINIIWELIPMTVPESSSKLSSLAKVQKIIEKIQVLARNAHEDSYSMSKEDLHQFEQINKSLQSEYRYSSQSKYRRHITISVSLLFKLVPRFFKRQDNFSNFFQIHKYVGALLIKLGSKATLLDRKGFRQLFERNLEARQHSNQKRQSSYADKSMEKSTLINIVYKSIPKTWPALRKKVSLSTKVTRIREYVHELEEAANKSHQELSAEDQQRLAEIRCTDPTTVHSPRKLCKIELAAAEFLLIRTVPDAFRPQMESNNINNFHRVYQYIGSLLVDLERGHEWESEEHFWTSFSSFERSRYAPANQKGENVEQSTRASTASAAIESGASSTVPTLPAARSRQTLLLALMSKNSQKVARELASGMPSEAAKSQNFKSMWRIRTAIINFLWKIIIVVVPSESSTCLNLVAKLVNIIVHIRTLEKTAGFQSRTLSKKNSRELERIKNNLATPTFKYKDSKIHGKDMNIAMRLLFETIPPFTREQSKVGNFRWVYAYLGQLLTKLGKEKAWPGMQSFEKLLKGSNLSIRKHQVPRKRRAKPGKKASRVPPPGSDPPSNAPAQDQPIY